MGNRKNLQFLKERQVSPCFEAEHERRYDGKIGLLVFGLMVLGLILGSSTNGKIQSAKAQVCRQIRVLKWSHAVRLNPDTIIDMFPKKMWQNSGPADQGPGNLNHFCIVLSKQAWDSLLVRLESNDVNIEEGPAARWGAHGTGTSIYFRDPEKNLIVARYYEDDKGSEKCLLGS